MGNVVQLPWVSGTPAAAESLGPCEWCRGAEAVRWVEVTPAKRKTAGHALALHERAVLVAACDACAPRLERQAAERLERLERQKKSNRAATSAHGRR